MIWQTIRRLQRDLGSERVEKIKTKFMTIVNYLKLLFWVHEPDVRKKATSIQLSLHFSVRFSTGSNNIDCSL